MIWFYLFQFITSTLNSVFSFLPVVTTLPTVDGVDLDTTMQNAVSFFNALTHSGFWMIGDVWTGALALMTYYALKMLMRFLLGTRTPGT